MGARIDYSVGGRNVSSRDFFDNIEKEALRLAREGILERIQSVRCPVHHQGASDINMSSSSGSMQFEFKACCERLREEVSKAFQ